MNLSPVVLTLAVLHVTIVALVTLFVRGCLKRRFASSRAVVGCVGVACIFIVTALAFVPLPVVWPMFDKHGPQAVASVSGEIKSEQPPVRATPPGQETPNRVERAQSGETGVAFPFLQLRDGIEQAMSAVRSTSPRGRVLLTAGLLLGIGFSALRLLLSLLAVRRLYRASIPFQDERAERWTTELRHRGGFRGQIELRECAQIASAATFGLWRGVILLPTGWQTWSDDELFSVLAHEVAHIARRDYRQRLIAKLCTVVHFYLPLVRRCVGGLAIDQEFAADALARSLCGDEKSYVRGLAKLALRYDSTFPGDRGWSKVSIMPKSSDFLARRLEMLRTKSGAANDSTTRWLSALASASVVLVAVMATCLRGAVPQEGSKSEEPSERLFAREPFDVSMIPYAHDGAFLIRVAEMLKNPALRERILEWSKSFVWEAEEFKLTENCTIDPWDIEWVASSARVWTRMSKTRKKVDGKWVVEEGDDAVLGIGNINLVIRMTRSHDWQASMLKYFRGATRETRKGKSYVQLPIIPALGPFAGPRLLFPDDKTIVVYGALDRGNGTKNEALDEYMFGHRAQQRDYAWRDAWQSVDGGLFTMVSDNEQTGWTALPERKKDWPNYTAPLIEKTKYYAVGCDFSEQLNRGGIQIRATCHAANTVPELQLSAITLLSKWQSIFTGSEYPSFEKYPQRILEFFSGIRIEPSLPASGSHYIHATAEASLSAEELLTLLQKWTE